MVKNANEESKAPSCSCSNCLPNSKIGRPKDERIDRAVLREALVELSTHGIRNLRIKAIADRAGVSRASIYSRWPNRDDLILEALIGEHPVLTAPDTGNLRGDLRLIISQWAEMYRNPAMLSVFSRLDAEQAEFPHIVEKYIQRVRAPANKMVEDAIGRASVRGELRSGVSVKVTARAIVGTLRLQTQLEGPVSANFEQQLLDFILQAITSDTVRRKHP